ncbi:BppU family phage baseplate upper protein [Clostridium tertium]|uniref:BppU family phage baseplate upper protein n=1 Tax=Clostridium tertium TaxID=1559 RepID=UPI0034A1C58B
MASKININLDTSKENYLVTKCKQNDNLTLEAFIYENGLALDLTNKTITIQALKSDNTYIIQNTDIVKENNKINAELDRDFSRVPGTTKIEIVLVESSKQNTTFSFYLEVVASVIRGAVQSSNTATILEALDNKIIEAGQVKQETEELIESGGAAKKEDIININASLEQINNKNSTLFDGELKLLENTKVYSNKKLPPTEINATSVNGNTEIENINLTTNNTVLFNTNGSDIKLKDNILKSGNMSININVPNKENITIANNDIEGGNYPLLLNEQAKNNSNINILFNNIYSKNGGDSIEINSPSANDDSVRNVKIIGNTLYSTEQSEVTHNKGFGIGLAQARDVVVIGNVSEQSPQEGLHIEDGCENVSVIGNVYNNCITDGCWITSDFYNNENNIKKKPYLILGNHFKQKNNTKIGVGIKYVADSSTSYATDDMFIGNRIEGFNYGVELSTSQQNIVLDNTIINNCNVGIKVSGKIKGLIYMNDTPKLIEVTGYTDIDGGIISNSSVNIDTFMTGTGLVINGKLIYNVNVTEVLGSGVYTKVKLLKINNNNILKGDLRVSSKDIDNVYSISLSKSVLTGGDSFLSLKNSSYGNLKLSIDGEYLILTIFNNGSTKNNENIKITLNGVYAQ